MMSSAKRRHYGIVGGMIVLIAVHFALWMADESSVLFDILVRLTLVVGGIYLMTSWRPKP